MTTHRDFTGVPFVAGSILGERCFDVADDGKLKSPMKPFLWREATNDSLCMKSDATIAGKFRNRTWREAYEVAKQFIPDGTRVDRVSPVGGHSFSFMSVGDLQLRIDYWALNGTRGHVTINRDVFEDTLHATFGHEFGPCSCGFYAYLNGYNEYRAPWRATGVIEGFGECFIGDRGFRCQRARVLAVTFADGWFTRAHVNRVRAQYPNVSIFTNERVMLREFPPTNVSEVIGLKDEEDD